MLLSIGSFSPLSTIARLLGLMCNFCDIPAAVTLPVMLLTWMSPEISIGSLAGLGGRFFLPLATLTTLSVPSGSTSTFVRSRLSTSVRPSATLLKPDVSAFHSDNSVRTRDACRTNPPLSSNSFRPLTVIPLFQPSDQSATSTLPSRFSLTIPSTIDRAGPMLSSVGTNSPSSRRKTTIPAITKGQRRRLRFFSALAAGGGGDALASPTFGSGNGCGGGGSSLANAFAIKNTPPP